MAVKYTIEFSSDTGSKIDYELDILDTSFSGVPTKLKGQASPITIEWKKDRDVYSPIMGSKASINLLIDEGDSIDDFNDAAPFTYEVRLRYKDSGNNLHDVWKGWIDPNDGEERVGSFPYPVSYVATDGMANLDRPVRAPEDRENVLLLHYILFALEQTGLGLDVYIDSSIINENEDDALITTKVNELAFMSEDTERVYPQIADSRRDVLEGILSAFNCSVRQSNGRWYIFNNSLHGGTGSDESNTWNVYEYNTSSSSKIDGTNYEKVTDVSEDLLYTLSGTNSTDLYISNESMFLIPRYPFGSVEARFQDLRPLQLLTNPRFDNGSEGWTAHSSSIDQTLVFEEVESVNGQSLKTNRTRKDSNALSEIWFETKASDAKNISRTFPHQLKFHWRVDTSDNDTKKVRLKYQIYAKFQSNLSAERISQLNLFNPIAWLFGNVVERTTTTTDTIYFDHRDGYWSLDTANGGYDDYHINVAETDSFGGWSEETLDIGKIGDYIRTLGGGTDVPDEKPELYIRFFYPESVKGNGRTNSNSTSDATVYVDNLSLKGVYTGDDAKPVFERVQDNYTTTMDYRPRIIGENVLDQQFYEITDTFDYWESGADVDAVDSRGLEQIVTNQKLKDWQDQFFYYETTFINNSNVPIGQHNKIHLNLSEHNSSTTLIQDGGVFNPKTGTYKVGMYMPNQTGGDNFGAVDSDGNGPFYRHDVTLVGQDPPERQNRKTYVVGFNLNAVDDDDNEVEDGLMASQYWDIAVGEPGTLVSRSFIISAADGYEIDGTVDLRDDDTNPAPTYMRSVNIERLGSNVEVSYQIEIPEESEFEEAYFDATVDELIGDNSRVILQASNGMTNATIQQGGGEITEIGPVGSTEKFLYYIVPNDTYQMDASALTVTLTSVKDGPNSSDTDVANVVDSSDIEIIQAGVGLIVSIPFTYQNTSPVYVKLNFTGTATTIPAEGTVTARVTASEVGSDTSNWSITDSDITLTCVPGTPLRYLFEINPESGRVLPPGNVSLGSIEEGFLGTYSVTGDQASSTEAIVFLEATCPTSNSTAAINISATTIAGGAQDNLHSYGITWTDPSNTTINNSGSGTTFELLEGQTSEFILSLEADTGYNLGNISIDTSSLPAGMEYQGRQDFGDLGEVELSDFFFLITGQSNDDTGNAIPFNGTSDGANNKYTLLINIGTDDDAVNATPSQSIIRIPFAPADTNEAISSTTFTIHSSETGMEYGATTDVSFTVTEDTDHNGAFACSATSISDGVITATITGTLPDADNLPEDGIAEVDIFIGGPATNSKAATEGKIIYGTRNNNESTMPRTDTFFKAEVTSNGAWDRVVDYSATCNGVYTTHPGSGAEQDSGTPDGSFFHQTFANNTGSDQCFRLRLYPEGDTSTVLDTLIIRHLGNYSTMSPDVTSIRVLTQAQYNALGNVVNTDNVLYLIEQ